MKEDSDKKVKDLELKLATAATTAAATRRQSKATKDDSANTKAMQRKVAKSLHIFLLLSQAVLYGIVYMGYSSLTFQLSGSGVYIKPKVTGSNPGLTDQ